MNSKTLVLESHTVLGVIRDVYPGSRITYTNFFHPWSRIRIPDPGANKALYPWSRSATLKFIGLNLTQTKVHPSAIPLFSNKRKLIRTLVSCSNDWNFMEPARRHFFSRLVFWNSGSQNYTGNEMDSIILRTYPQYGQQSHYVRSTESLNLKFMIKIRLPSQFN